MTTKGQIRYHPREKDDDVLVAANTDDAMDDRRKRRRLSPGIAAGGNNKDFFDPLPDDIVISILCKLSSTARRPSDFMSVLLTCKRLKDLAVNPVVLCRASPKTFAIRAKRWSDTAHKFMKRCADAGNVEACYTLGMIRFYCLQNRGSGASLMAKAAIKSHAPALYSLAVIQFNGSGGSKNDKDLRAGVALCSRAAFIGDVDALRELGHCLQDGYGVPRNVTEGRRFLIQANARELAAAITTRSYYVSWSPRATSSHFSHLHERRVDGTHLDGCKLLSDFGCNVPAPVIHPANKFLVEWFDIHRGVLGPELRLCSHAGCGRPETRRHEFRRCSVCGVVNYCSRACQALDWKLRHKGQCMPVERWVDVYGYGGEGNHNGNGEGDGQGNGDGGFDVIGES